MTTITTLIVFAATFSAAYDLEWIQRLIDWVNK